MSKKNEAASTAPTVRSYDSLTLSEIVRARVDADVTAGWAGVCESLGVEPDDANLKKVAARWNNALAAAKVALKAGPDKVPAKALQNAQTMIGVKSFPRGRNGGAPWETLSNLL